MLANSVDVMTEGEVRADEETRACHRCGGQVRWMLTHHGDRLAFEPLPVLRAYDVQGDGWVPGPWTVNGRLMTVLAPLHRYGAFKRMRASRVLLPHLCRPRRYSPQEAA